jgi:hypothetical protein
VEQQNEFFHPSDANQVAAALSKWLGLPPKNCEFSEQYSIAIRVATVRSEHGAWQFSRCDAATPIADP